MAARTTSETDTSPIPMGMFVGDWLSYSETFIYDQLVHQNRFQTWVFARSLIRACKDRFPYERVTTLSLWEQLRYATAGSSPTYLRKLKELQPRILHAHYGLNGVRALPFSKALDCPLVVTFHGHDIAGLFPENRYTHRYWRYQRLAGTMFESARLFLCCSQELADLLIQRFDVPEYKVQIHRLGVDVNKFHVPERSHGLRNILMVGRLVEKKGFAFGIRAFAKIIPKHPGLQLKIIGDGPLRSELVALVEELDIKDAVTFTGALPSRDVQSAMEEAHVLLAPSVVASNGDRESGVIVLKEAGATGLPCIGTIHGGIPEIIDHGETGLLVEEKKVEPLAQSLLMLIRDEALHQQMSQAARRKILRDFNTTVQNQRLEEILLSLL